MLCFHHSAYIGLRQPAHPRLQSNAGCAASLAQPRLRRRAVATSAAATGTTTTRATEEPRTATVEVDVGYAAEQAVVPLVLPDSTLAQARMAFPLGLVLESMNGEVVVSEVSEASAAAEAGCRVGDVVRATTAFTMQMTYPTMNVMFGGVGRPKLVKMLLPTDKVPFAKVMDAVRSNSAAQGGDGSIVLVLERRGGRSAGGNSSSSGNGSGDGGPGEPDAASSSSSSGVSEGEDGAVFDPKLFE